MGVRSGFGGEGSVVAVSPVLGLGLSVPAFAMLAAIATVIAMAIAKQENPSGSDANNPQIPRSESAPPFFPEARLFPI
jgi:hypothetical protein